MSVERHYFPGNNTPQGFFSYYGNILGQREARRIYCIKGGPGTGKTTTIKSLIGAYYKWSGTILIDGKKNESEDAKRQICKKCKETDKRWNAKNLKGNPYSFYEGDENYTEELGCIGCYQYDPVEYRKQSVKRISKEASENTTEFIMKKLYGDDK